MKITEIKQIIPLTHELNIVYKSPNNDGGLKIICEKYEKSMQKAKDYYKTLSDDEKNIFNKKFNEIKFNIKFLALVKVDNCGEVEDRILPINHLVENGMFSPSILDKYQDEDENFLRYEEYSNNLIK